MRSLLINNSLPILPKCLVTNKISHGHRKTSDFLTHFNRWPVSNRGSSKSSAKWTINSHPRQICFCMFWPYCNLTMTRGYAYLPFLWYCSWLDSTVLKHQFISWGNFYLVELENFDLNIACWCMKFSHTCHVSTIVC